MIGAALSLALCSTALASCSGNRSDQVTSEAPDIDSAWEGKTEKQLREAIEAAPANGLRPDLFLKGGEKGGALTVAALKYASALANGYADPKKLHEVYTLPYKKVDVRAGLKQAIEKADVKGWLETLVPQTEEYRALGQAHLHYLQLAAKTQFQPVPEGDAIKPGSRDARIAAVATALRTAGYLEDPQNAVPPEQQGKAQARPAAQPVYGGAMVAAVKRLQGDFGFEQDGIIGGNTLNALNAGPGFRARQIAVAMERLRWLPREAPKTRIDVNTAAAFLDYYRDGQPADHRNVVTGEVDKPTPQLQSPMYRLVAKPTWTVPKGIGEKELATKGEQWLAENDFIMKDGLYVQQSGDKNSLGLVKFDMDNEQAIYLHDTPAKALFGMPDRHRSHGCVRVDRALQFATMLADQEGVTDDFTKAMQGDEQQVFVKLPQPIPVRLLYHTVFWDGSEVQFRQDVYGWDENIARALGLAPGKPERIDQPESSDDIGP
jgi:murein L,D-transpeptidase YcbB/YkuD